LNHFAAQRAVSSALQVDDMNQRRRRRHDAGHERFNRLAEDHSVEIALLETDGVVAEEVESGDHLHSSVLAC
jgi:hypothetical protein